MANNLSKVFFKIAKASRSVGKNLTARDREWNALLRKWNQLDAEKKYRTHYPALHPQAIVFDLGGYKGQWASDIFSQYLCSVYVFEPHPEFYSKIKNRFKENDKIKIFDFGLASKDEVVTFATDADSTSMFKKGQKQVDVQLKNAQHFLEQSEITTIDLMKINIEGGEYDLLEHLIETEWIKQINNLQIQFHNFVPNAKERMIAIQNKLEQTHSTTYQYPFFWENWKRNR